MPKPRKYLKGPKYRYVCDVVQDIAAGRYIMMFDKPQHPSWMGSMQLRQIILMVRLGRLSRAAPNPEHPDNKKWGAECAHS